MTAFEPCSSCTDELVVRARGAAGARPPPRDLYIFRATCSRWSAVPGCSACPIRPNMAAAGSSLRDVSLQVVEKLAAGWLAIGLGGQPPQTPACFPIAAFGSARQREQWLPRLLGGDLLGAYCLSEPHCGRTRRRCAPAPRVALGGYTVDGVGEGVDHPRRRRRLLCAVRPHCTARGWDRTARRGSAACTCPPAYLGYPPRRPSGRWACVPLSPLR